MKKATYVITVSKVYLKDHIRAGQLTGFRDLILAGKKPHTMRGNYEYWKGIADKVNAGAGVLSLRQWVDIPYNSKQEEFLAVHKMNVQKIDVKLYGNIVTIKINGISQTATQEALIIKNDGLSHADFLSWFKGDLINGALIWFSDSKY